MIFLRRVLLLAVLGLFSRDCRAAADPLEVFEHPPQRAKIGVWWLWMGGQVSREGLVRDLDWFARSGVGMATVFALSDTCIPEAVSVGGLPENAPVAFTGAWFELLAFACDEAEKRGIEMGLHNCPGYTSTGGPWIPPELGMRRLVLDEPPGADQVPVGEVGGHRIGHVLMPSRNLPAQPGATGYECDKMNPEAVRFHLDHVLGQLRRHLGTRVGRSLKFILLDSYEAGTPNWTPRMREEFTSRRGYDPLPFLPVLCGQKAGGTEPERRFKADFERTVKDLYRESLFVTMRERLHSVGLEFACEPYWGPFDPQECAKEVDRLMTEFWYRPGKVKSLPKPRGWADWTGRNGRRHNVLEAEAFTSSPDRCKWNETPARFKASGDVEFVRGVNRFVIPVPHQPWSGRIAPGMTAGCWGAHFGRTQTWALPSRGWFDYVNRCQALLQWGEPGKPNLDGRNFRPARGKVSGVTRTADGKVVAFLANLEDYPVDMDAVLKSGDVLPEWFDPVSGKVVPLVCDGLRVPLHFAARGSGFLVFRQPMRTVRPSIASLAVQGVSVAGPALACDGWSVSFPADGVCNGGRDLQVRLGELADWTSFADSRIRHFSGTATYRTAFDRPSGAWHGICFGDCKGQVLRVRINGRDLGTVWCDPWIVSVPSEILRDRGNELVAECTNTWANRLIGDEAEPPDAEFAKSERMRGSYLVRWPEWLRNGTARPGKRLSFVTWNCFVPDADLEPSGLSSEIRWCRYSEKKD